VRRPGRGRSPRAGRPDAYELAVERGAEAERADDLLPALPSGRGTRRVMLYVLIGGVAVAVARGTLGVHGPDVPGSCTRPVLALHPTEVRAQGSVQWTLSGPADAQVVLALDATSPPAQGEPGWLAGPLPLRSCKAHGAFAVGQEGGNHQVRVFVVGPGPVRVLTQQRVTVDTRG
jgi:hypothetical protein